MRILSLVLFTLVTLVSVSVAAAENKIATVDVVKAVFGSNVAKARLGQAQGQSDYVALQAKYESTLADMKALKKEADNKGMTWSKEKSDEAQKKMEFLRADLELLTRKVQAEQKSLQESIMQELQPKAGEALEELIKEEGITLLVHSEAVIFAATELNLTDKLTDRLNKKTK